MDDRGTAPTSTDEATVVDLAGADGAGTTLVFRVLGPLRAQRDDEELGLGGPRQRLVLALLLAADGATVRTEALIEQVWEGEPPATARKALQGYVHHLRSGVGDAIATTSGGYAVPDARTDARRFDELCTAARRLLDVDPERARTLLDEALGLWHGPAFADLRGHGAVDETARVLDQQRVQALADRVDAELALGRHAAVLGEVESLAAEYPYDERLLAQLVLAQYRCGRQVDALGSLERHRLLLRDELGLEPGPGLRELERRVLGHDPALAPPVATASGRGSVRGFELRETVATDGAAELVRGYQRSVGRDVLLTIHGSATADDPVFIADHGRVAKALGSLGHPNVVPLLDAWREPGHAYQVASWFPGGTLRDRIEHRSEPGPGPTTSWRLRVLRDVAEGLDAARRVGVTHGALTPDVVWLAADGRALVGSFPLAGPPDDRSDEDAFAELAGWLLASDTEASSVVAEIRAAGGIAPLQLVRALEARTGLAPSRTTPRAATSRRNPYKGLRAFGEVDEADFHGRETLTAQLAEAVDRHRFVAVVGASGSGKSSVVRAGLLPRLRRDTGPGTLLVAEMFPGTHPFEELEAALLRIAVDRAPLEDLAADERGLLRATKRIRPDDDCEVLLLVDQFEELWTMVDDPRVRDLFIGSLATAAGEPRSPLRIVVTLRADFFDRPLQHPRLGPLVRTGLVPVTPPEPDELARAIAAPATTEGVGFAEGLVTQIVQEVGRRPGALPLLQHTLTELFETRSGDVITLADLQAAGGVLGAVGRRAEALYTELPPPAQHALRQVLLRLVSVEDGTDDLRRRIRRSELVGLVDDQAALDDALGSFAQHRLLVLDRDETSRGGTVEIAHEALLREWPRLADWIATHRDDLRLRRRLAASVDEWVASGEDPAYLLRDARLREFDAWAASTSLALGQTEHAMLQASLEAETGRAASAVSRRRRLTSAVAAVAVVLAGVGGFAGVQRRDAATQAHAAETNRLASTAIELANSDPRVAMLLAVAAHERSATPSTAGALQTALVEASPLLGYLGSGTAYADVVWLGDDRVAGIRGDGVDLFDVDTGALIDTVEVAVVPEVLTSQRLGDLHRTTAASGSRLVVVSAARQLVVMDASEQGLDVTMTLRTAGAAGDTAIAADGSWIAGSTVDGEVVVWEADGVVRWRDSVTDAPSLQDEVLPQYGFGVPMQDWLRGQPALPVLEAVGDELWMTLGGTVTRFGPSGARLATVVVDVPFGPVDASFPSLMNRLSVAGEDVVVSGMGVGRLALDLATQEETLSLVRLEGTYGHGEPTPGRGALAAGLVWVGLSDGHLVAHDPGTGVQVERHDLGLDAASSTAASPDQRRLAVASDDGLVVVSPLGASPISHALPRSPTQTMVSVSEDGRLVAAGPETEPGLVTVARIGRRTLGTVEVEAMVVASDEAFGAQVHGGSQPLVTAMTAANQYATAVLGWSTPGGRLEERWTWDSVAVNAGAEPFQPRSLMTMAADGSMLLMGRVFGEVRDPGTGRVRERVIHPSPPDPTPPLSGLGMDPVTGDALFSWADGTSLLVELADGNAGDVTQVDGNVTLGAWNGDGSLLATITSGGLIQLRDGRSLAVSRTFRGRAGTPVAPGGSQMLFVDEGRRLLTNLSDGVRLWDVATGDPIGRPLPSPTGAVAAVNGSDRPQAATVSDRATLVWDLEVDSWADTACRAAGSNLTEDEWAQWGPQDEEHRAICPDHTLSGTADASA